THELGAMQGFDGRFGRESGSNELAAAGESQHEMGFNEAHGDVQVGREKALVNVYGRARLGGAEEAVFPRFARVVIEYAVVSGNEIPANLGDLRIGRRTMEAGGNHDGD